MPEITFESRFTPLFHSVFTSTRAIFIWELRIVFAKLCLLYSRKQQSRFDLFYYDGLARQDEEIRLTIGEANNAQFGSYLFSSPFSSSLVNNLLHFC